MATIFFSTVPMPPKKTADNRKAAIWPSTLYKLLPWSRDYMKRKPASDSPPSASPQLVQNPDLRPGKSAAGGYSP